MKNIKPKNPYYKIARKKAGVVESRKYKRLKNKQQKEVIDQLNQ